MTDYLRTIAAYLTGWVIAQSIFLRVWNHVMRNSRDESWRTMADDLAVVLADELDSRRRHDVPTHEELAERLWVQLRQYAPEAQNGDGLVVRPETVFAACRSLRTVVPIVRPPA